MGGLALFEMCPAGFRVWHHLRLQGMGGGAAVVIWLSVSRLSGVQLHRLPNVRARRAFTACCALFAKFSDMAVVVSQFVSFVS